MMLKELTEGTKVTELQVGLVSMQIRVTKLGDDFLSALLSDKTGKIPAIMWQVNKDECADLVEGGIVSVSGEVKAHKGKLQLELTSIMTVEVDSCSLELMADLPAKVKLDDVLSVLKNTVKHSLLPIDRDIFNKVFSVDGRYDQFINAPAAQNNHHIYRHGLLLHSVNVMEICFHSQVRTHLQPYVDMSLLVLCAILHDVGKIYELSWGAATTYTTAGQLGNHSLIGARIVRDACLECNAPGERTEAIVHCIHAHHGKHEFEASVLPKTPEAIILHLADMLESKMEVIRMAQEDVGCNGGWSENVFALGVPLYFRDTLG